MTLRILAALLALTLVLPSPVFALRIIESDEAKSGIRQALTSTVPDPTGLEQGAGKGAKRPSITQPMPDDAPVARAESLLKLLENPQGVQLATGGELEAAMGQAALPDDYQQVIRGAFGYGFSNQELATMRRARPENIQSLLFLALREFRESYQLSAGMEEGFNRMLFVAQKDADLKFLSDQAAIWNKRTAGRWPDQKVQARDVASALQHVHDDEAFDVVLIGARGFEPEQGDALVAEIHRVSPATQVAVVDDKALERRDDLWSLLDGLKATEQFVRVLRRLFNDPNISHLNVANITKLAEDFGGEKAGPTSEVVWEECEVSARKLLQQQLTAPTPQPSQVSTTKTPIVALAPTGALDFSVTLKPEGDRLVVDPSGVRLTLGGAPINVMAAFALLGTDFEPVGTYGEGPRGELQLALMKRAGIPIDPAGHWVKLSSDTPFNLFPIIRHGAEHRIIGAPPAWSAQEREAFTTQVRQVCQGKEGGVFVVASRPPGGDPTVMGDLLGIGREHRLVTCYNPKADVVSHPEMLQRILKQTDIFIANVAELATMAQQQEATLRRHPREIIDQARRLMEGYPLMRVMLISLDEDGALWIERNRVAYAPAPKIAVGSSTGAGDTALAALVTRYARHRETRTDYSFDTLSDGETAELLQIFIAAGTETARHEGTGGATREGIAEMERQVTASVYDDAALAKLDAVWPSHAGLEEVPRRKFLGTLMGGLLGASAGVSAGLGFSPKQSASAGSPQETQWRNGVARQTTTAMIVGASVGALLGNRFPGFVVRPEDNAPQQKKRERTRVRPADLRILLVYGTEDRLAQVKGWVTQAITHSEFSGRIDPVKQIEAVRVTDTAAAAEVVKRRAPQIVVTDRGLLAFEVAHAAKEVGGMTLVEMVFGPTLSREETELGVQDGFDVLLNVPFVHEGYEKAFRDVFEVAMRMHQAPDANAAGMEEQTAVALTQNAPPSAISDMPHGPISLNRAAAWVASWGPGTSIDDKLVIQGKLISIFSYLELRDMHFDELSRALQSGMGLGGQSRVVFQLSASPGGTGKIVTIRSAATGLEETREIPEEAVKKVVGVVTGILKERWWGIEADTVRLDPGDYWTSDSYQYKTGRSDWQRAIPPSSQELPREFVSSLRWWRRPINVHRTAVGNKRQREELNDVIRRYPAIAQAFLNAAKEKGRKEPSYLLVLRLGELVIYTLSWPVFSSPTGGLRPLEEDRNFYPERPVWIMAKSLYDKKGPFYTWEKSKAAVVLTQEDIAVVERRPESAGLEEKAVDHQELLNVIQLALKRYTNLVVHDMGPDSLTLLQARNPVRRLKFKAAVGHQDVQNQNTMVKITVEYLDGENKWFVRFEDPFTDTRGRSTHEVSTSSPGKVVFILEDFFSHPGVQESLSRQNSLKGLSAGLEEVQPRDFFFDVFGKNIMPAEQEMLRAMVERLTVLHEAPDHLKKVVEIGNDGSRWPILVAAVFPDAEVQVVDVSGRSFRSLSADHRLLRQRLQSQGRRIGEITFVERDGAELTPAQGYLMDSVDHVGATHVFTGLDYQWIRAGGWTIEQLMDPRSFAAPDAYETVPLRFTANLLSMVRQGGTIYVSAGEPYAGGGSYFAHDVLLERLAKKLGITLRSVKPILYMEGANVATYVVDQKPQDLIDRLAAFGLQRANYQPAIHEEGAAGLEEGPEFILSYGNHALLTFDSRTIKLSPRTWRNTAKRPKPGRGNRHRRIHFEVVGEEKRDLLFLEEGFFSQRVEALGPQGFRDYLARFASSDKDASPGWYLNLMGKHYPLRVFVIPAATLMDFSKSISDSESARTILRRLGEQALILTVTGRGVSPGVSFTIDAAHQATLLVDGQSVSGKTTLRNGAQISVTSATGLEEKVDGGQIEASRSALAEFQKRWEELRVSLGQAGEGRDELASPLVSLETALSGDPDLSKVFRALSALHSAVFGLGPPIEKNSKDSLREPLENAINLFLETHDQRSRSPAGVPFDDLKPGGILVERGTGRYFTIRSKDANEIGLAPRHSDGRSGSTRVSLREDKYNPPDWSYTSELITKSTGLEEMAFDDFVRSLEEGGVQLSAQQNAAIQRARERGATHVIRIPMAEGPHGDSTVTLYMDEGWDIRAEDVVPQWQIGLPRDGGTVRFDAALYSNDSELKAPAVGIRETTRGSYKSSWMPTILLASLADFELLQPQLVYAVATDHRFMGKAVPVLSVLIRPEEREIDIFN